MKKILTLLAATLFLSGVSITSRAQNRGDARILIEGQASTYDKNFKYSNYAFAMQYYFLKQTYGGLKIQNQLEMPRKNGTRVGIHDAVLGIEGGYTFKPRGDESYDLRFGWGLPLNAHSYKYFYYEGGIYDVIRFKYLDLIVGAGARYYASRSSEFKDKVVGFVTMGFTFTLKK